MISNSLAGIEYLGEQGITSSCKDAVIQLVHSGVNITDVKVLTLLGDHCDSHAFLITLSDKRLIVIKNGFTSGYAGEGPRGYSYVLTLLNIFTDKITEFAVSKKVFERITTSSLTLSDLNTISKLKLLNQNRIWDEICYEEEKKHLVFNDFPISFPMSILDKRLIKLAIDFHENPDNAIFNAYRNLESIIRKRTGLPHESSSKLMAKAFLGDESILEWVEIDKGEQTGRANLFTGSFMAFRNNRAHREPANCIEDDVREFLLINQLYVLEEKARRKKPVVT